MNFSNWMKNGVNSILSLSGPGRRTGISCVNTSNILWQYVNLLYTTNTVEGYHRQIRKVTKNKGVFPSDTALEKLVYLAYRNIRKKWTMPLANWATISQQLAIKFGERFKLL